MACHPRPLPEEIQIGYLTFQVEGRYGLTVSEEDEDEYAQTGDPIRGCLSHEDGSLRYDAAMGRRQRANTLVHEVMHGCYHQAGLHAHPDLARMEEFLVESLTNAMVDFMVRNPEYTRHVIESLEE